MIAAKVKLVRGCNFDNVGIRRFAAEARLRRKHCGGEEVFVANPIEPAKSRERLSVNFANDLDAQMKAIVWRRTHANFRNVLR